MGGFLLLPEDEVVLVAHLLAEESLTRLAHDDLTYGPPVAGPLTTPRPLGDPPTFTFWVSRLGELRATSSLVDHEHSPILVWNRSSWHASGALCAGRLRAQTRPRKDQPKALLRVHERVERWMKREGVKLNPFHHAPVERPAGEKPSAVFALPHAAQWVREGGTIWPWPA